MFEPLSSYSEIYSIYNFYSFKDIDIIEDIIEEMINCVPHLTFLKALVDRISYEKHPFL